ncbi:hypothetical protein ScPMuIL_015063 [Solemya velum]
MEHEEQKIALYEATVNCLNSMSHYVNYQNDSECPMTWDGVMCWNATAPGTIAKQACPHYIAGFRTSGFAVRICTENSTWYSNPLYIKNTSMGWTNYSSCFYPEQDPSIQEHMVRIRMMYTVGYGISLVSLLVALAIMLCSKRLHSRNNTLHINLFLAFIMRAMLSFLKDSLFVQGVALEKDITTDVNGNVNFIKEGMHWECKMLFSIFMYSIAVSQIWIFIEGLYLHMLVYRTLFTERHGVKFYIILGWTLPLTFVVPWVAVRITHANEVCWNTNPVPEYLWIIRGPLITTIVINVIFFLDILRVLFIRLGVNQRGQSRYKSRYRKLAKFILVLLPLFGVLYIVFSFIPHDDLNTSIDIPHIYAEMFYNSFQGFILAVLFCFLNEEVHSELRRVWYKYGFRRKDSFRTNRSFVWSSWRKSSYQTRTSGTGVDGVSDFRFNKNGKVTRSQTENGYGKKTMLKVTKNRMSDDTNHYEIETKDTTDGDYCSKTLELQNTKEEIEMT